MASLFKEKTKKGESYRIQFYDGNGMRKSIRLGSVPKKIAETVCSRVEELITSQLAGSTPPQETSAWLGKLSDDLYDKLASAGIVPARKSAKLGQFIEEYIQRRKDIKKGTVTRWNLDRKKLIAFFGEECRAEKITTTEANSFKQHLFAEGLARATISKHLANSKMFFDVMLEEGLINSNPFAKVSETSTVDQSRNVYVSANDVNRAMQAAPDAEWRLIIALSRFGGLRSPSEVLSLKWSCIDWEQKRITVISPKTDRYPNGSQREIPIFPELVEPLRDMEKVASKNSEYIVVKHRPKAADKKDWSVCNLREPFLDILKRAGLKPWPKLFHALRGSCETDLIENGYPIHAITAWMGHSTSIALRHYLRNRDEYFDRAVKDGIKLVRFPEKQPEEAAVEAEKDNLKYEQEPVRKAVQSVQKTVLQASAGSGKEMPRNKKSPENRAYCERSQIHAATKMTPTGLEPVSQP